MTLTTLNDYLLTYFQGVLKAPLSDPISISRDSLIEMLMKVTALISSLKYNVVQVERNDQGSRGHRSLGTSVNRARK